MNKKQIEKTLNNLGISINQCSIFFENNQFVVDVNTDVYIDNKNLNKLPIRFGIINGDFNCYGNKIKNFENFPHTVNGDFNCAKNKLKSLKGCPSYIGGDLDISLNQLKNLDFFPVVKKSIDIRHNQLKSLKGLPEVVEGSLSISYNQLESLNYCSRIINSYFYCDNNQLKSLKGCPKIIKSTFNCSFNQISDLNYFPKEIGEDINISCNKIKKLKNIPSYIKGSFFCDSNQLEELDYSIKIKNDFCFKNNPLKELLNFHVGSESIYLDSHILGLISKDMIDKIIKISPQIICYNNEVISSKELLEMWNKKQVNEHLIKNLITKISPLNKI